MGDYVVTRSTDGRLLWTLCAVLFSVGFVLLLGIGAVFMVGALAWAGYLAYTRTPGFTYALGTIGIVAVALLAAWALF